MVNRIAVTSLDLPQLRPYRTLRQSVEHVREGIFVAEGEKVVRRLLESPVHVLSVLITDEWLSEYQSTLNGRKEAIDVFVADKALLEEIVGFHLHQGIMAVAKVPKPATLDEVLSSSPSPRLFVALDGLTNSENLGVVVRNCAAFGVQAILVGETSSSPYLRRAVRNSMGTVFKLPVVHLDDLEGTLSSLQGTHGFTTIAAHPHTEQRSLTQTEFRRDCVIVFGSEGEGISKPVLRVCTMHVAIPMQLGVDSLNVASASAVFLHEVWRQRRSD